MTVERKLNLESLETKINNSYQSGPLVYRSKVPGGWLVFMVDNGSDGDAGWGYGGATFYPDPEHKWDGGSLTDEPN